MAGAANGDGDIIPDNDRFIHVPGWRHTPKLHTCRHCDRIIITHRHLKYGLISLPHTRSEALQAEADRCPVFKELTWGSSASARHHGPADLWGFPKFLFGIKKVGNLDSKVGFKSRISEVLAQNKASMLLSKTQFIFDNIRRRHLHLLLGPGKHYLFYGTTHIWNDAQLKLLQGHEGAIDAFGDVSLSVLHSKVDTESVYGNLQAILSSCQSSHEVCRISPTGFVPSRLLEVSPDPGPSRVRLVETTSGRQWTWACLSHVWGGDQRQKTTRDVLPEYLENICFETLPQTIKDAVNVCRGLLIPYLWIDSLCIVQDDKLDKAREIPRMALVYRHARLTIAAANAHNVEEGFLHHQRPLCYRRFAPTGLRFRERRGGESKALVLTEHQSRHHETTEPIDTRAWALQEKLLSPRLLSYSSHGPLWSCRALLQDATQEPAQVSHPRAIVHDPIAPLVYDDIVPCIPGLATQPWESVVQLYSSRQATLHSDKLVALSAVAQTYSENNQDYGAYLAGIWEKSIREGLMWWVENIDILPRPPEYTAPTWSWASVGGVVHYEREYRSLKFDEDFKVVSAKTIKVNSNEFGALTAGTLIVDARVRGCCVEKQRQEWPSPFTFFQISDGPEILLRADTLEIWTSICNEDTEVTLLLLAGSSDLFHGLVLAKTADNDSFVRVSHFTAENDRSIKSRRDYDEFFAAFEVKRVTIV